MSVSLELEPPCRRGFGPLGRGEEIALRWYTVVVDCRDAAAQAEWWQETIG
jgi:hypothetical protein